MVSKYTCWQCRDETVRSSGGRLYWFTKKELIERKEDSNHTDFCCPKCERVIICVTRNKLEGLK